MKIETKFNIGDTVYFLEGNRISYLPITEISVRICEYKSTELCVDYIVCDDENSSLERRLPKEIVFSTPEELTENLIKEMK